MHCLMYKLILLNPLPVRILTGARRAVRVQPRHAAIRQISALRKVHTAEIAALDQRWQRTESARLALLDDCFMFEEEATLLRASSTLS